jgi:hypothetical protein
MVKFSHNKPLIDLRLRAQVLYFARGRCANCGKTIEKHGIALVVCHKVSLRFGGQTEAGNLWAVCEECITGKLNSFRRIGADKLRKIKENRSVHLRLGETLKAFHGEPVAPAVLKFAADQDTWTTRLRELRYLGWKIKATRLGDGPAFYRLVKSKPWTSDPTGEIRRYERERAERNRNDE